MDHRKILVAYLHDVLCQEGTDFLGSARKTDWQELSQEEFEELLQCSEEALKLYKEI